MLSDSLKGSENLPLSFLKNILKYQAFNLLMKFDNQHGRDKMAAKKKVKPKKK